MVTSGYHSPPHALASCVSADAPKQTPIANAQIVCFRKLMACVSLLRSTSPNAPRASDPTTECVVGFKQQVACQPNFCAIAGVWAQVRVRGPTTRVRNHQPLVAFEPSWLRADAQLGRG